MTEPDSSVSWVEKAFGAPDWPVFEYDYEFDRRQPDDVFESIIAWLAQNGGAVRWAQEPNAALAVQGRHTFYGWNKDSKKYLVFELTATPFGCSVHVIAAPTKLGMTEVSAMRREVREDWAFLLEELWGSMGDKKSAARVADLRLRSVRASDPGRELVNKMIAVLSIIMTLVILVTFLLWVLVTQAGADYLEVPQIISMTILLVLWQMMTYAVVKRVASDRRLAGSEG